MDEYKNTNLQDVDPDYFSRVFEVFKEFGQEERHFNSLEQQYRLLSSTWMLATFAGIGYVIKEYHSFGINSSSGLWFFVSAIAFAGFLGISLLGYLDQRAYHKLLHSIFMTGIKLEEDHPFLPRMRTNMLESQDGKDITKRVAFFYIIPATMLFGISLSSLIYALYLKNISELILFILPIILLISLALLIRKVYLDLW